MAGPACLIPVQCVRLYELCKTHSYADALVLQKQLWKLNELFSTFHLVPCIKAGLEILGYDVGKPVLPLMPLSDKGKRQLEDILLEIRNS
jgi:4-hydroxy-tetrahydrodipicolinate synthase